MKTEYDLLRMQHVKRSPMIGFGEGGDGNFTCQIYVLHAGSIYDNIVKYLFVYIGMFGSCHCQCRDVEESGSLVFQSHLSHQDFVDIVMYRSLFSRCFSCALCSRRPREQRSIRRIEVFCPASTIYACFFVNDQI